MIVCELHALFGVFLKKYYLRFHMSITSGIMKAAVKTDWQNGDEEHKYHCLNYVLSDEYT